MIIHQHAGIVPAKDVTSGAFTAVTSAGLDILFQQGVHLLNLLRMLFCNVGVFFDVLIQIIQCIRHGDAVIQNLLDRFGAADRQLEWPLTDSEGAVMMIMDNCLMEGDGPRFALQRRVETDAIFCGAALERDVQHLCQRRQDVVEDDGGRTGFARLDDRGPAYEKRYAVPPFFEAPFPAGTGTVAVVTVNHGVAANPALGITFGAVHGSIVAGEDDESVVGDAQVVQLPEQLANVVIELDDEIAIGAGFAFAHELLVGNDRVMGRGHRVIEEEGLIRFRADRGLDELAGLVRQRGNESIHGIAGGDNVIVPAVPFAVLCFGLGGSHGGYDGDAVVLDEGGGVHLCRTGGAEGVSESEVSRPFQGRRSEVDIFKVLIVGINADLCPLAFVVQLPVDALVPFTDESGLVASVLHQVRNRFAARFDQGACEIREVTPRTQAGPPHVATGEQAVAGGDTIGARSVGIGEGQALTGELIEMGCRNPAVGVEGGDVTIAHIIGKYKYNIRYTLLFRGICYIKRTKHNV